MFTAAARQDRGAARGLRRQGLRRPRRGVHEHAAARPAARGDPVRRPARGARPRLHEVIDATVGDGLEELIDERALASRACSPRPTSTASARCRWRRREARRLQPHYIELLHGGLHAGSADASSQREQGRYEITNVPAAHPRRDRQIGTGAPLTSATSASPSTAASVQLAGLPPADLLAPGHPLLDAVDRPSRSSATRRRAQPGHGARRSHDPGGAPAARRRSTQEVADGAPEAGRPTVSAVRLRRLLRHGAAPPGPAPVPRLRRRADEQATAPRRAQPWLAQRRRGQVAMRWIIAHQLRDHLAEVQPCVPRRGPRTQGRSAQRLTEEINHWDTPAGCRIARAGAAGREAEGVRREPSTARRVELDARLRRAAALARRSSSSCRPLPPRIVAARLVAAAWACSKATCRPTRRRSHAKETEEVERRGVDAGAGRERELGRRARRAWRSTTRASTSCPPRPTGDTYRIEVKGRIDGRRRLHRHPQRGADRRRTPSALPPRPGEVDPRGAEHDEVRYLDRSLRRPTELLTRHLTSRPGRGRSAATGTRTLLRQGGGRRTCHGARLAIHRQVASTAASATRRHRRTTRVTSVAGVRHLRVAVAAETGDAACAGPSTRSRT